MNASARFRISARSWIVLGVGLALVALLWALTQAGVGGDTGALWLADFGQPLVIIYSGVVIFGAARSFGPGAFRRQWLFIGAAALVYAVGDLTWGYFEVIRGVEPAYPGLPDLFYLLQYPLLGLGLALALAGYRRIVDVRRPVIAALGITAAATLAEWIWFLKPLVLSADASKGEIALNALYPLADTILLFGPALAVAFVVRRLGGGRFSWPWIAVVLGVLLLAASDFAYVLLQARDLYESGMFVDYGWSLGNVAIALGASIAWDLADPRAWR